MNGWPLEEGSNEGPFFSKAQGTYPHVQCTYEKKMPGMPDEWALLPEKRRPFPLRTRCVQGRASERMQNGRRLKREKRDLFRGEGSKSDWRAEKDENRDTQEY